MNPTYVYHQATDTVGEVVRVAVNEDGSSEWAIHYQEEGGRGVFWARRDECRIITWGEYVTRWTVCQRRP